MSKKASNPPPPNTQSFEQTLYFRRMTKVFDEWLLRYQADPDEFGRICNEEGFYPAGYGEQCALYFNTIVREMDALGKLPKS